MVSKRLKEKPRILFAEDVMIHHRMAVEILHSEHLEFEALLVSTREDFIRALDEFRPDLVITDYQMPGFDGMEVIHLTMNHDPTLPIIVLTGSISEEVAVECMRQGAINYVLKENLIRLPFAVNEAIEKKIALVEKTRVLQALTESESKLQTITNAAGDAIVMMDEEGQISFWNPAAERIFGYGNAEVIGKDLHALISPPEFYQDFSDHFRKFQESGTGNAIGQPRELEAINKEGDRFYISLNLSAVMIKGKWHAVGIISDITVRRKAAQELLAAKQRAETSDRLKTAFINNISHEVRTPLNGILGFADLVTQSDLPEQEKRSYYAMIKSSSKRLLDTMTSYMDISMIVTGNMQIQKKIFDLNQIMQSLYEQYRPSYEIKKLGFTLKIPIPGEPFLIDSDPSFFSKIISHLLENALKFTFSGAVTMGYAKTRSTLNFFVTDTGIGISKEIQPRIFDSFMQEEHSQTRGFDGSGLGLAIVQGLVNLLGGEVVLKSEKGKGSTFFFTVPCQVAQVSKQPEQKSEPVAKSIRKPVILIAEDDEPNYLFLKTLLIRWGYETVWATNGKDAVRISTERDDLCLILMDIKMPVMDGLSATRLIKPQKPDISIIAVTAYAMRGDEQKALDAGCDDYITKPIVEELLLKKIRKYIPK